MQQLTESTYLKLKNLTQTIGHILTTQALMRGLAYELLRRADNYNLAYLDPGEGETVRLGFDLSLFGLIEQVCNYKATYGDTKFIDVMTEQLGLSADQVWFVELLVRELDA